MESEREALHGRKDPRRSRTLKALRELALARNEAIDDVLGPPFRIDSAINRQLQLRRLSGNDTGPATLARLFRLGVPVSVDEARRALAPVDPADLVELGLVKMDRQQLEPTARISVYEGLVYASDPAGRLGGSDFVTGPNPSGRRVDRLTVRRPVARALDLGTGPGVHALAAASHAGHVVAVDVNQRALVFAALNAELNEVDNVELRQGSWFEPVRGERFDLIAANPPYVVSPSSDYLYRDGDLPADEVSRKLILEAPDHLEEGGLAHIVGNWAHTGGEDWRDPLESLIAGSGCDAVLLRFHPLDLVAYAANWNLPVPAGGPERFLESVDDWLRYYRDEGIEAITDCMVVLRKRTGRNWIRAFEVPGFPTGRAGEQVLRLFEARDRRDELASDQAMLNARFALAPGLSVTSRASGPRLAERRTTVYLEDGIGYAARIPPELVQGLTALDGTRPLRDVADSEEAVAAARRLFALGLLILA